MTAALAERGSYEISPERQRWGWVNDGAIFEGRAYAAKAPGTSFLAVPGYAAYYGVTRLLGLSFDRTTALWICRVTASVLPFFVFLLLVRRWFSRQITDSLVVDAIVTSVAFGSLLYGYGLLLVSHTTCAVFGFGSFMLLHEARTATRPVPPGRLVLAGFLAAGATALEYPAFCISLALSLYAVVCLRSLRSVTWFGLGALVPTLGVMHFHWKAFGSPLQAGHVFAETQEFRSSTTVGFYGAESFRPEAVWELLMNPGFGMFPLTPLLAFALLGAPLLIARRTSRLDALVAVACIVGTVTIIACMSYWRGGWTLGPRYLAPVVMFIAWFAAHGLVFVRERLSVPRWAFAGLVVGLVATSLVASGILSAYYPHVPEAITRPLHLVIVLFRENLVPANMGELVGLAGTASMLPWFAAMIAVPVMLLHREALPTRDTVLSAVFALVVALGAIWALAAPEPSAAAHDRIDFVVDHWGR